MSLTEQQKKRLRGMGHNLKPVILVGAGGLSESLLEEFDRSLAHHELMKIKISLINLCKFKITRTLVILCDSIKISLKLVFKDNNLFAFSNANLSMAFNISDFINGKSDIISIKLYTKDLFSE